MPSGPCCMVKNCGNNKKECPELTFFNLPKKMDVAEKWIKFSGRKDIDLGKVYTMCSNHFSSDQFRSVHPRKLLYPGSVPNMNGSNADENKITLEYVGGDSCMEEPNVEENEMILESIGGDPCTERPNAEENAPNEIIFESVDVPSTPNKRVPSSRKRSPRTLRLLQKYKSKINALQCKIKRKNLSILFSGGKPPISRSKASIIKMIYESKEVLSKEAHTIFRNELKSNFVKKNNRRYDDDMREMCLLWHYASPKGYRAISKYLSLPTPRTLRNWQSKLKVSPGISPQLIESLRLFFSKNKDQKKPICCLMFDEISLSEELHFDQSSGKIIGVVDIGTLRTNEKATTALVCMARGVAYNWKYVMGYWFLGSKATNEYLHSIVLNSIDAAQQAGLMVKGIVCDQSPVNQSLARKLEISMERCFFFRNGIKIHFIYDVPHLLKSIRNNLAKYDLEYSGKPVSWKYIQHVCTSPNPVRVRLLPKVTNEHLNVTTFNAMRVKYASQVLSESVSVAMVVFMQIGDLPAESKFTAEFVSDMDKAFDCLNSNKLEKDQYKMRYAMSEDSPHTDFLINIRDNFMNSKFLSKRSVPPCINGFIVTINSILELAEELRNEYNIPKLLTRHLNQDPIENFFATVRQQHGCCRNPSPQQFEYGLRHNYIASMYKLCSNSNCEEDSAFTLEKLKKLNKITSSEDKRMTSMFELKDIEDVEINLEEKNAIFYVSGYIARKFLKLHPCELCTNILLDKDKLLTEQYQLFTYFKQGESIDPNKGLVYASQELFNYVEKLEIIHSEYFNELLWKNSIVKELMDIVKLKHRLELPLCSPETSDKFLQLFMTIRCHWGVRFINQGRKKKVATKNQKLKNILHE